MQVSKPTKSPKNSDNKAKRRKLSKESADKNSSAANNVNALDDLNAKDDVNAIDRPVKKGGRKGNKKRKKLHRADDGYFCESPSASLDIKIMKKREFDC